MTCPAIIHKPVERILFPPSKQPFSRIRTTFPSPVGTLSFTSLGSTTILTTFPGPTASRWSNWVLSMLNFTCSMWFCILVYCIIIYHVRCISGLQNRCFCFTGSFCFWFTCVCRFTHSIFFVSMLYFSFVLYAWYINGFSCNGMRTWICIWTQYSEPYCQCGRRV